MTDEKVKVVILSGDDPAFRERLKSLIEAADAEVVSEEDAKRVLLVDDYPRLGPQVFKRLEMGEVDLSIGLKDNQPWYNRYRKSKY